MGDDVGLGEIARRAEAVPELLVERQVDINLLIEGTVEWPHGRKARSATGPYATAEQDELRIGISLPVLVEDPPPHVLSVGQHHGDELLEFVLACPVWPLHRRTLPPR